MLWINPAGTSIRKKRDGGELDTGRELAGLIDARRPGRASGVPDVGVPHGDVFPAG
ncbi:MAG: hypothetical protein MZV64_29570 [Ignavibacteriales bacterium]|nr:hypothetical protein [Ignavibacteriales bacterium]